MSHPLVEMPRGLFNDLIRDLKSEGEGRRESGAFLLGSLVPSRRVVEYLLYSAISPKTIREHCYIALTGEDMSRAWNYCAKRNLRVVADVHTHPGSPGQSRSDRADPMVSLRGHVALIVPNFATTEPTPRDLGVHQYQGDGRWMSLFHADAERAFKLT